MELDIVSVRLKKEDTLFHTLPYIKDDKDAAYLFREFLSDIDREVVALLTLDAKLKPINLSVVSMGTLNSSLVHPREIFKTAILSNAQSVMLGHNHPSGDPTPSEEDIQLTARLQQVGELLGIELLDHIVIGKGDRYCSLAGEQYLTFPGRQRLSKGKSVAQESLEEKVPKQWKEILNRKSVLSKLSKWPGGR
mgnify:FL=1